MFDKISLIYTGTSNQREFFTLKSGSIHKKAYPATVCLLHHKKIGNILIDTGYSLSMKKKSGLATYWLYKHLIGSKVDNNSLLNSIKPEQVSLLVLSHFHPDHIGGYSQFSVVPTIASKQIKELEKHSRLAQLREGFFSPLFNSKNVNNFIEDFQIIKLFREKGETSLGYDLLGDGSLIAFATPGHALGHYSFIIKTLDGPICYGADAAWHSEAIIEDRYPNKITKLFVENYSDMIYSLQQLKNISLKYPSIPFVFCHCTLSHNNLKQFFKNKGETHFEIIKNNYLP
ncbi:MBL fold metallo-hydrolase [Listeria monocytogenes]|uniref:MBL fold metallo-hydrolase n=1 Tax=Listeria monocytogenes TaxID=1639 RepID=UPI0010F05F06|nr:MBL fold metallo-hydrolase [Listeria monocytogenes]EAD0693627.1 MBL fold metallo-hydrolase [Listeria monocytogenes]EAE1481887.1 MBL fold metallo-hydrolase [Listeria monocytogenes]EAF5217241.1 MBL fold metallo-hydrolase [Listeria monocytogenes]EAG1934353.1 MBL fold metallo-hydrolase [Listeria monocytogenes]EAH4075399.1 MBL fold metallo-hydrolase [Listeria monocytogenes]